MNPALQSSAAQTQESLGNPHVVRETRKLLTTPLICARGGFSRWTWRRWVRSGIAPQPVTLPGHPRWEADKVDRFLAGRTSRYFGSAR